ncbi:MAG: antitoxin AF2212-like protein [Chloroflexota bacterium]
MDIFTVQAVYKKGVLKPKTKLDLPEDALVEVQVRPVKPYQKSGIGSLIGMWQDLSDAEVDEIEENLDQIRQQSGTRVKRISSRK